MAKEETKEELKLDHSARNALATNQRQIVYRKSTIYTKRNKQIAKKIKIVLAEQSNLMEADEKSRKTEKRAKIEIIRWSKKSKKSCTVPQVMDGGGFEVGPPEMPGMHQRSTFKKKI